MERKDWQWNEFQQVGTDYTTMTEVEAYDERMASFRNVDGENRELVELLGLPKEAAMLEIGCVTGRFARFAAAQGYRVTAIDISAVMLEYVRAKAAKEGLQRLETQHSGFLSMDFLSGSFDAVISGAALHHLPDAWKLVALSNIVRVLKPGGQFVLSDVVFKLKGDEPPEGCFVKFIESFNDKIRSGAMGHVKKEYSTYDWIMEGLLAQAGFNILSVKVCSESFFVYHCRRKSL